MILVGLTATVDGTGVGLGVGVGPGVGVGLGVGDGVGVGPGVGVDVGVGSEVGVGVGLGAGGDVAPCTIVNVSSALCELVSSVARIVWEPRCKPGLTASVTSKAPLLSAMTVPCGTAGCCNCPASSMLNAIAAPALYRDSLRPWYASGMWLSSVRVTVLPGVNPCPCRCNVPPGTIVLLPTSESEVGGGIRA